MIDVHTDWHTDPSAVNDRSLLALARRRVVLLALADAPLGLTEYRLASMTGLTRNQVRSALDALTWEAPLYEYHWPNDPATRYVLGTDAPVVWRAGYAWRHERDLTANPADDPTPRVPSARIPAEWRRRWT